MWVRGVMDKRQDGVVVLGWVHRSKDEVRSCAVPSLELIIGWAVYNLWVVKYRQQAIYTENMDRFF